MIICIKGSICQIQTLEGLLRLSRLHLSDQDTIIIPLYCNRNSKHLSIPNKNILEKLSSQIAEPLLIAEISPNSIHVSRPNQYTILIQIARIIDN